MGVDFRKRQARDKKTNSWKSKVGFSIIQRRKRVGTKSQEGAAIQKTTGNGQAPGLGSRGLSKDGQPTLQEKGAKGGKRTRPVTAQKRERLHKRKRHGEKSFDRSVRGVGTDKKTSRPVFSKNSLQADPH